MFRRHPPHKMLSLLLVMLAMLSYFSFDLYSREHAKVRHGVPYMENISNPSIQPIPKAPETSQENQNTEVQGSRPEDISIQPGAVIVLEKKYTHCGHVYRKQANVPNDLVNLTQDQLKLAYKDWVIKKFSPNEIIIVQEIDSKCPNHFILKDKDGMVAVYYQNPVNDITLKEVTPILVKNLPTKDKEKLKTGIRAESKQELAQILEDLGS